MATRFREKILPPHRSGQRLHIPSRSTLLFFYLQQETQHAVSPISIRDRWGTNHRSHDRDPRCQPLRFTTATTARVLNRFLKLSGRDRLSAHRPLATWSDPAFIHIRDSVKCVELAVATRPNPGEKGPIYNQDDRKPTRSKGSGREGAAVTAPR